MGTPNADKKIPLRHSLLGATFLGVGGGNLINNNRHAAIGLQKLYHNTAHANVAGIHKKGIKPSLGAMQPGGFIEMDKGSINPQAIKYRADSKGKAFVSSNGLFSKSIRMNHQTTVSALVSQKDYANKFKHDAVWMPSGSKHDSAFTQHRIHPSQIVGSGHRFSKTRRLADIRKGLGTLGHAKGLVGVAAGVGLVGLGVAIGHKAIKDHRANRMLVNG